MIRAGTVAEVRACPELIAAAAAETGIVADRIGWGRLDELADRGDLIVLVVEIAGEVAGYGCAVCAPDLWCGTWRAETISLYVRPAARRAHGGRLLLAMVRAAAARGMPLRVAAAADSSLARLLARSRRRVVSAELTGRPVDLA